MGILWDLSINRMSTRVYSGKFVAATRCVVCYCSNFFSPLESYLGVLLAGCMSYLYPTRSCLPVYVHPYEVEIWVFPKIGKHPKMDGENNGKSHFLRDDLGGKPTIFGNIHIPTLGTSQEVGPLFSLLYATTPFPAGAPKGIMWVNIPVPSMIWLRYCWQVWDTTISAIWSLFERFSEDTSCCQPSKAEIYLR